MSKISFKRIFVVLVGILTAMIVLHYAALKRLGTPITVGKIDITEMEKTKAYFDTLLEEYYPETEWDFTNAQNDLANGPTVQAQAALLVDLNTGELLFEKNSDEKRAIASLAKVMTAIIALEHRDLEDTIRISKKAAEIGENNMGISEGELYTLEELLYGLVLNSGNDSAYAIAENVAGDTETFVFWMNFKAEQLGLEDTRFYDPSGLDDRSYSTPKDLAKLTRYALKNPKFRELVKTIEIELIAEEHKYIYMYNQTNLLATYPGVEGVKTGYTEVAGLCLITYANNENTEVIGVVLDSPDRKGDMILMLDHGYNAKGISIEHNLL